MVLDLVCVLFIIAGFCGIDPTQAVTHTEVQSGEDRRVPERTRCIRRLLPHRGGHACVSVQSVDVPYRFLTKVPRFVAGLCVFDSAALQQMLIQPIEVHRR